jgi:hypothetical protein
VEYSHEGDRCTFDYIVKKHDITDPAIHQLALIVRGADTDRVDLSPEAAGLWPYPPVFPTITKTITSSCPSA